MLRHSQHTAVLFLAVISILTATGFSQESAPATCRLADAAEHQDWDQINDIISSNDEHAAQPDGMTLSLIHI